MSPAAASAVTLIDTRPVMEVLAALVARGALSLDEGLRIASYLGAAYVRGEEAYEALVEDVIRPAMEVQT